MFDGGRSLTGTQLRVLERSQVRAQTSDTVKRGRELERLALALAAHDPARTLARGYALVEARDGEPLGSAAAARAAGAVSLRFHDGTLPARVDSSEAATVTERTYESAVARVEEIIRRLDSGDAGLRETLDLVKEGRELVEYCAGELDAVSQGLEELRLDELVTRLESNTR